MAQGMKGDGSVGAMTAGLEDARIMASLRHPNIIRFKEVFHDRHMKQLCIVMEYANYHSLERIINIKRQKRKQNLKTKKKP